jgi:hypothetical protein
VDKTKGRTSLLKLNNTPGMPDGIFFNQKWANFGGLKNGKVWYSLRTFGLFYGHLVYFMDV